MKSPSKNIAALATHATHAIYATAALLLPATHTSAADPKFVLATKQVGISEESLTGPGYLGEMNRMTGGACVNDFNNDTYPDIFIPSLGTYPNKLYINNTDGTFTDQAQQWNINNIELSMGVTSADINNDGYQDLYLVSLGEPGPNGAQPGKCKLYINSGPDHQGNHTFTDIAQQAGVNTVMGHIPAGTTPAFGDIDLDGDLDLFVATWIANEGGNRLFENQLMQTGSPTFIDITSESLSTPDRLPIIQGFTPHIVDINGDKFPEILLTADFLTSEIFVNNGPNKDERSTFRTTTNKSNINADMNGMGAAIADFNQDGLLDWFQTNIRLVDQDRGNTLYMCTKIDQHGDPIFQNQAQQRAVLDNGWGWGVLAADFDNDTDTDLIATNGWPGWPNKATRFWSNDGTGHFSDRPIQSGLSFNINGRGIVSLDHDKDGDLDLLFIDNNGPIRFYRNDIPIKDGFTNSLRVRLDTSSHPCLAPNGYGSTITATINGKTQLHPVHNNASYLSQSELTTHIGLELATQADHLRIDWTDGSTTTLNNIQANQEIVVNAYHPVDLNKDSRLNFQDASTLIAAFQSNNPQADFNNNGSLEYDDILDYIHAFNNACK